MVKKQNRDETVNPHDESAIEHATETAGSSTNLALLGDTAIAGPPSKALDAFKHTKVGPISDFETSLDMTDPTQSVMAFNALSEADIKLGDDHSVVIHAEHYFLHPIPITNPDTGEVTEALRVVFICTDGRTFATTSTIVADRLARLLRFYDGAHFDTPVYLKITERPATKRKGTYHDLKLVPQALIDNGSVKLS